MQTNRRLKTITNHLYPKSLTLNETSSGSGKTSSVISAKHRRRSLKARKQSPQLPLLIQPEIREALARGGPVVALESTIISHGMPYPENVKTAKQVEEVIRSNGAIPATIAILNGVIHVGLNDEQLDTLGRLGSKVRKCSRRDLALVVANKENGATTVAGTMLVAHMVGIDVFVTGGIGGVHRGGESSLDVSADLTELGRTPVCVICAGVKSILDIPRTLEYLETQGVAVVGYGTSDFPAFFTSKSGSEAPCRLDSPHQIAQLIHSNKLLSLKSGMIVGVPIPAQFEAQAAPIEQAIQRALKEADEKKIVGKEATPFLLSRVNQLTGGASLKSNIALVLNNAKIGAQIAAKLSMITKAKMQASSQALVRNAKTDVSANPVVVIGGAAVDIIGKAGPEHQLETSNPGSVRIKFGGVGRNIAEVMHRLRVQSVLVSAVGADNFGFMLLNHIQRDLNSGIDGIVRAPQQATAVYSCILDNKGDLVTAIADMDVFHKAISPDHIRQMKEYIREAPMIVLDGNITAEVCAAACELASSFNVPVFFEPTSVAKSRIALRCLHQITFAKPNQDELFEMANSFDTSRKHTTVEECLRVLVINAGIKHVLLTRGAEGVIHATADATRSLVLTHYPAEPVARIVNCTGAGDSFVGGFVAGYVRGLSLAAAIAAGMRCSKLSLESEDAVSPALAPEVVFTS